MNQGSDLIIATIGLSLGGAIWLYFLTKDKIFSVWLAIVGCSAIVPLFFHLRFDLAISWLAWLGVLFGIGFYLKKKYPDKMKEWEKSFHIFQ